MKFTPGTRHLAASLALAALVGLAAGQQKARLPFRCFAEEWAAAFVVSPPTYEQTTGKLAWALEVKKDVQLGAYEAFVCDANGVESATADVTFTPKRAEYKAKAKVTATVMLTHIDADDVCNVKIRLKK